MRKLMTLISLLILCLNNSFAQEVQGQLEDIPKNYLVLKPFETTLLPSFEMNQINKIMLQVASKQTDFHLLLTQADSIEGVKSKITGLQLYLTKKGDFYLIEAKLFDLRNDKQIKIKRVDHILKKDIQRQIYLLLESIFGIDEKKKIK